MNKFASRVMSRRQFIQRSGGCATLTSMSLMSTLVNLRMTNAVLAATGGLSGYKALVCLFQFGGNDSFNMLTAYDESGNFGPDEYNDYVAARGGIYDPDTNPAGLALSKTDLLQIQDMNNRQFGLHPGMAALKGLYDNTSGKGYKVAFVANCGSLVQPTTLAEYQSGAPVPLGLFSHSDEQRNWQTALPQTRSEQIGWLGRAGDVLTDSVNNNPAISMIYSLNSAPPIVVGRETSPYIVSNNGARTLAGYGANNVIDRIYTKSTDSLLEQKFIDLFEMTHASRKRSSIDAAIAFNQATGNVQLNTVFPQTSLGRQMEMVARIIGSRDALQQTRQCFLVSIGGFDNHADLISRHNVLLPQVAEALSAFYDATVELGVQNDVTAFTASDFGRTLRSNGRGSDHAWGGCHVVMGGSVHGGHVYGQYPLSLAPGNSLDTGRGRLVPTTAVDEYAKELVTWFGCPDDNNLRIILPNIDNFAGRPPLGFMT